MLTMLKQLLLSGLSRAWVAFVIVAFVAGAAFLAFDRDNPLESDDPYVVGFTCGAIGAAMAAMYTIIEAVAKRQVVVLTTYFALLLGWCAFLVVQSILGRAAGGHHHGMYTYAAIASFLIGAGTLPLFRRRLPPRVVICVSV
ncbi:hypothetical protein LCGC14_2383170, partial [marine sediment metagenome]